MKRPNPDRQSEHILSLARRLIALPFIFAVATYRWLKGMVQRVKSSKDVRADDQAHQSQVRRELRGLPPDHVQPPAERGNTNAGEKRQ